MYCDHMKQKSKKDYHLTSVRMPPETKKRVRFAAAREDTSMADMTATLVGMGLAIYEETHGLPPESIRAKTDTAA